MKMFLKFFIKSYFRPLLAFFRFIFFLSLSLSFSLSLSLFFIFFSFSPSLNLDLYFVTLNQTSKSCWIVDSLKVKNRKKQKNNLYSIHWVTQVLFHNGMNHRKKGEVIFPEKPSSKSFIGAHRGGEGGGGQLMYPL